jgi:hypothetical protein
MPRRGAGHPEPHRPSGAARVTEPPTQLPPAHLRHQLREALRVAVPELRRGRGDARPPALTDDARRPQARRVNAGRKGESGRDDPARAREGEGLGRDDEAPVLLSPRGGEVAGLANAIPVAIGVLGVRDDKAGIPGIGDPTAVEIRGRWGATAWGR